jgi:crotonobetainyl-CoA:carnitine CoA-transferase CaiB-like acyl-CoA transferase
LPAPTSALTDVRVLDFTRVLAGPFCTMILADLGADVIKVESLDGDETRQWGPPFDAQGRSAYYLSVNRNKRSLTLNLKSEAGRQIARQLAANSQIVVENFKPGGMAAFGLGYDDLRGINPALVYASISGFGQTGPYHERPGYDFVIQAMSGLMSITGEVGGEPSKVGVAIADVVAGLFASSSILAALRHAERSGEGQRLDIALLDTQIAALVNVASSALVSGQTPARYGNAHASIVPYQTFRAADGEFALAVGNDRQFAQLCQLIERAEWASDPRFSTNPARVQNRDVLIALLGSVFSTRPAAEWVAGALALNIPAGTLNTVSQILEDEHIQARGLIHVIDAVRMVGNPVGFSATPPTVRSVPPDLGEHTDAILRERLGLRDDEIARYRADGVI